ncbi:MAG: sulfatase-like hydrolase/transferase [Melioribacteraceae bacterium]|nr:sulfatase-like hydrolase/transferase [Melioribacteraceae bacterium]
MRKIIVIILFVVSTLMARELPKIKNVVVIIADDHALNVTGAYGNKYIKTPSIDKLAEEGIKFTNSYCNSPICSASRQSLLTGKYPHATGVNLLFTPFPDEGNTTIAEHLQDHNYKTALFGKTHFNNWVWYDLYKNGLPKHGFDTLVQNREYNKYYNSLEKMELPTDQKFYNSEQIDKENIAEWMNCNALPHPVYDKNSSGTFYANEAIDFIRQNKENPFFVWLAFHEPHHPYYFPIEYEDKYDPAEIPLPKGSLEDDRWIPEKFKNLTLDEKRGIISAYYCSVEYMDKNIGLVTAAIDEMGLSGNTLIVYISDNGYLLNDHKRFEKHTMWEEAIRQPMIIKAGDDFRHGEKSDALIEYVDIVPTILDMIDVTPLKEAQGSSFLEVIKGFSSSHKEYAFSTYLEDNLAMITDSKWKYVFTTGSRDLGIGYKTGYGPSGITHRLYDLINDPKETTDVSKKKENQELLMNLKNRLLKSFIETHPDANKLPNSLTLDGKLVWFCEPRDVGADQSLDPIPVKVFKTK